MKLILLISEYNERTLAMIYILTLHLGNFTQRLIKIFLKMMTTFGGFTTLNNMILQLHLLKQRPKS
jgi:hypothetical protein